MQRWNPIELNFEGLEMPENIPTDRPELVDKKWVIYQAIVFTPGAAVNKMSTALFCIFS